MKRHHDHNKSYNGKHLIGMAYIFRGFVHYHDGTTGWCEGKLGAGDVTESPTSSLTGIVLTQWEWLDCNETSKSTFTATLSLQ